jgi:hypothetical protein
LQGLMSSKQHHTYSHEPCPFPFASGTCAAPGNLTAKWDFTYDGDGVRTGQSYTPYTNGTPGTAVITRYYFGGAFETTGSTWKKYYFFAGQTVAMRDSTGLKSPWLYPRYE